MKNQKDYRNHKGFTLVELIVVIVILAILAAILIPGLLKWIDQAKQKQYELEARNIYLATEASLMELHTRGFADTGKNASSMGKPWDLNGIRKDCFTLGPESGGNGNVKWLTYIEKMSGISNITYVRCYIDHGKLEALAIKYELSDGKAIRATIRDKEEYDKYVASKKLSGWKWSDDGSWNIEVMD